MLGVIGDVVQDIVVWTEEEVRPATDTKSQIRMARGGSAANVAAFAAPRYPTRFMGCVGDDLGGHVVERELSDRGVEVRLQRRGDTGMIVVLIDQDGERNMFPSRGASGLLEAIDPEWLQDIEILHLTGYSLQEEPTASSVIAAARAVRAAGGKLSFDVSSTGMIELYGREAFVDLLVELAPDYISANQDEAALVELAGPDGPGPLLARLPGSVLLARAGQNDTRVMCGTQILAIVPVQPAEVVRDLTGAGDAFNAGFLTAILQDPGPDPDLAAAVEAAHALARRVLAHAGATEGADT